MTWIKRPTCQSLRPLRCRSAGSRWWCAPCRRTTSATISARATTSTARAAPQSICSVSSPASKERSCDSRSAQKCENAHQACTVNVPELNRDHYNCILNSRQLLVQTRRAWSLFPSNHGCTGRRRPAKFALQSMHSPFSFMHKSICFLHAATSECQGPNCPEEQETRAGGASLASAHAAVWLFLPLLAPLLHLS